MTSRHYNSTYTVTAYPEANCEVGTGPKAAIGYVGNRSKSAFHYSFASNEKRDEFVARFVASCKASVVRKAEQEAERKASRTNDGFEVGQIFSTCWGYEQTNREFFEIVEIVGRASVKVRQIACSIEHTSSMSGEAKAIPGRFIGEAATRQCRSGIIVNVDGRGNSGSMRSAGYVSWYA